MATWSRTESPAGGPRKVSVDGALTIYEALADMPAIVRALADAGEARLDLTALSELDTAGAQLLLVLAREAENRGIRVRVDAHGQASREAFESLGLPLDLDTARLG